jgi:hypothetical protein
VRIEVFYIDGCPNHLRTVERVKAMLKDLGVAGELVESAVNDPATVSALRFLGSPTVQVNGVDVEPSARTSNQFGFVCRTYLNGPRREGIPPRALIRDALLEACKWTAR